jgi:hypothetical protein
MKRLIFRGLLLLLVISTAIAPTFMAFSPARAEELLPNTNVSESVSQTQVNPDLPPAVALAVRGEIARTINIPPRQVRIVEATPQTWSDGCLGLQGADIGCATVLIEGWRVVAIDGKNHWVYRTDSTGQVVRMEAQTSDVNG